jgi:hypothetical protein
MAALAAVSAGADIMSGVFAMSAADAQRSSLRSQAALLRAESEADIARYAEETQGFKAEQSVRYLKSGVTLEGSPLEILDETTRVASENISAMRAKSAMEQQALKTKGAALKAQSRVDFMKSITGAGAKTAQAGEKAGWWNKKDAPTSSDYRTQSKMNLGFGSGSNLDLDRGF